MKRLPVKQIREEHKNMEAWILLRLNRLAILYDGPTTKAMIRQNKIILKSIKAGDFQMTSP